MTVPKRRDPAVVSKTMSRIRSKDTKAEVRLRKALWTKGLRYRKHYSRVAGTPDIAFPGPRVAVFCDGDFWHGRNWEARKARLATNREYWIPKIERNMARDERVNAELQSAGWVVIRVWETDIHRDLSGWAERIVSVVRSKRLEH